MKQTIATTIQPNDGDPLAVALRQAWEGVRERRRALTAHYAARVFTPPQPRRGPGTGFIRWDDDANEGRP